MNSNSHRPTPNLQRMTDCPADQGWQNLVTETDEKFTGAGHNMLTAANETHSYLNETVSDAMERVRTMIEANLEAKATKMIEEKMKKVEGELYKLVDENLNTVDGKLKRVEKMISEKNDQEGVSWVVADGQTKKLEQAFRDGSRGDFCSDAIERMNEVDQSVGALEKPVGKAVYHPLPKVDALFESLEFTSTTITADRIRLLLLGAKGFRLSPITPYLVSGLSTFSLNNDLLIASKCGDQKRVSELLLKGADKNVKCTHGYTPLHLAAKNGHVNVLNILLEYGADVNGGITKGMTPLHWAAKESSPSCVASLITAGADVDRKTDNDWTALHFACIADYEDVVQLLLKAGADRSVRNSYGKTPFDLAVSEGVKKLFSDTERGLSLSSHVLGVFCGL